MSPQDDSGREGGTDRRTAPVTELDDRLDTLESVAPSDLSHSSSAVPGVNVSTAALVAGGVFSVWAIRALANRRLRAIPYGAVGATLLLRGLSDVAGDTEALSLERESTDQFGVDDVGDPGEGEEGTVGVDDEVATDPRTTEDGVDVVRSAEPSADEATEPADELDGPVGEPPSANEASEATGPKPQQAEPTQTDATEPEDTPPEDASSATTAPPDGDTGDSTASIDEDEEDADAGSLEGNAEDDAEPADS
ncbi:hypothetical protein [Natrarchaeobaculum aegyptiacum]|uniref:Uncharacterized protein n=1 Tax=Natrarchaeobaculum aegyptiacum TaxID=745377 RepID=A0A2Z2HUD8_9EURY|nr:hypothetical protein [Natrarchaeobaculum aegyptiacum]ARS90871.1 hypothetical protein B1756_14810 [Natrarchaeobaculum aegyptiacum]